MTQWSRVNAQRQISFFETESSIFNFKQHFKKNLEKVHYANIKLEYASSNNSFQLRLNLAPVAPHPTMPRDDGRSLALVSLSLSRIDVIDGR